jgi:hypothetical protein
MVRDAFERADGLHKEHPDGGDGPAEDINLPSREDVDLDQVDMDRVVTLDVLRKNHVQRCPSGCIRTQRPLCHPPVDDLSTRRTAIRPLVGGPFAMPFARS